MTATETAETPDQDAERTSWRWGRPVAIGLVALFALVLVQNVYWGYVNQWSDQRQSCNYRVCARPRSLEQIARESSPGKIRSLIRNIYIFRRRIPGKKLTIPRRMEADRWELERVSGVRVEVSDQKFVVPPDKVASLKEKSRLQGKWYEGRAGGKQVTRPLFFRFPKGATEFVVAETADEKGPVFVLPVPEYAGLSGTSAP